MLHNFDGRKLDVRRNVAQIIFNVGKNLQLKVQQLLETKGSLLKKRLFLFGPHPCYSI
jgi:hypothetical protein